MSNNGNTYAEGAAIAHGASSAIADLVSESAKNNFKKAFHESLWAYLYRSDQENRDWIIQAIKTVSRCVAEGKTLDETRETLEREARAAGRV